MALKTHEQPKGVDIMSGLTKKIIAIAGASAFVSGAAMAADLTVVSWGGAYTKSQVEAYHKPWMAKTGKAIVSEDYGGGIAEIKAQVESGNVTWDVVDVELSDAIRACDEGLLEPIDHSILPPAPDGTPATEDFCPVHCMIVRSQTSFGHPYTLMIQAKHVTGTSQKQWLIFSTPRHFRASAACVSHQK